MSFPKFWTQADIDWSKKSDHSVADPRWDKRGRTTPWNAGKLARDSIEAPLDSCWKPPWMHANCSTKVPGGGEACCAQLHCALRARCVCVFF
ncbi:unnamed protein product [Prunus armeniaca]